MAKKKGNLYGKTVVYESKVKFKKTSISKRRPKFSSMNKSKKRSFKKYNRGGRSTRDQTFILMVSLYPTKCLRITDHHKVEDHVVIVVCSLKEECFAVYLELRE